MFDFDVHVRAAAGTASRHAAFQAVVCWLMVCLLIWAAALSGNQALHQTLHHDAPATGHFCLVCSLSTGQANAPEVAPLLTFFFSALFLLVCARFVFVLPAGFQYSLALGRAPPVS
jgi:hypothetical protein